jgi:hypothetical protein
MSQGPSVESDLTIILLRSDCEGLHDPLVVCLFSGYYSKFSIVVPYWNHMPTLSVVLELLCGVSTRQTVDPYLLCCTYNIGDMEGDAIADSTHTGSGSANTVFGHFECIKRILGAVVAICSTMEPCSTS